MVRGGGSLIMNRVAKKILARRGGGNPTQLLSVEMDKFEDWIGEQPFVCGESPSVGDIATHGCLTCISDFPTFDEIMKRPRISSWYQRVQEIRDSNRAQL